MDDAPPPAAARAAVRLLRGLGVVYAVAGASLWVQIVGLIGAHGILPLAERAGPATSSVAAWWQAPSALWWHPTDGALRAACAVVVAAGLGLAVLPARRLAGAAGALCAVAAWAGYLSLASAGDVFTGYQWDALLCESGFLAIWLTLALPRSAGDGRSPARILWLYRLLLARLLLASGVVKLRGDAVWRDLTALQYHFMTQPLPTAAAWWIHHLPHAALRAMTAAALAVELVAPLLAFGPPRARRAAAAVIVAFQLAIAATGTYGFLNLLTAVLCLSLVDGAGAAARPAAALAASARNGRRPVEAAVVVLVLWMTAAPIVLAAGRFPPPAVAGPLFAPFIALSSWRIVNPYGLFADMTTTRPEVIVEGTDDGVTWRPYEPRFLPGDVRRPPTLAGVHMPRLDWQLWFAALRAEGGGGAPGWLAQLLDGLKAADPAIVALFARDPFAGRPPRAVRAVLVEDRFSTAAQRRASGAWWVRTGGVTWLER